MSARLNPRYLMTYEALRDFIGKPCPGYGELAAHIGGGMDPEQVRADLDRLRVNGMITTLRRGIQRKICIDGQWTDWSNPRPVTEIKPKASEFRQYIESDQRKIAAGSMMLLKALEQALGMRATA